MQSGPSSGVQMDTDEAVPLPTKRKRRALKPARVAPIAFNTANEGGALGWLHTYRAINASNQVIVSAMHLV